MRLKLVDWAPCSRICVELPIIFQIIFTGNLSTRAFCWIVTYKLSVYDNILNHWKWFNFSNFYKCIWLRCEDTVIRNISGSSLASYSEVHLHYWVKCTLLWKQHLQNTTMLSCFEKLITYLPLGCFFSRNVLYYAKCTKPEL